MMRHCKLKSKTTLWARLGSLLVTVLTVVVGRFETASASIDTYKIRLSCIESG